MSTKCWQPILRYFVWKNVHWCFWDATRILQTRAVHNLQKGTYSKYGSFRWLMKSTLCNLSLFAEKKSKKGSQPSLSWLVNYTLSHRHLILLYSLQIPNVDYLVPIQMLFLFPAFTIHGNFVCLLFSPDKFHIEAILYILDQVSWLAFFV